MIRTTSRLFSCSKALCSPRITSPALRTLLYSPAHPVSRPRIPFDQVANMSGMTPVSTKEACPPAGPYSQAVRANGQIFVSGQIPADTSAKLVEGSIGDKTQACCDNIKAIVEAAGSSVQKIVKVNVFLTDMANFAEMNATYEKFFTHKPARSCVAVAQLPKGVPVEIECIALE